VKVDPDIYVNKKKSLSLSPNTLPLFKKKPKSKPNLRLSKSKHAIFDCKGVGI
jgi:hypothetical protein